MKFCKPRDFLDRQGWKFQQFEGTLICGITWCCFVWEETFDKDKGKLWETHPLCVGVLTT